MQGQRATLRDVARLAGVSPSAASMALSGHPRISDLTKAEVRSAAAHLGYVPNSAGRALRVRRAGAVALVVPNTGRHVFGHPYFMHLLVGVTDVGNREDCSIVVSTNPDEQHGVAAYERVLHSGAVDGAIVASAAASDPNVSRMVDSALPVVLIGRFPNLPNAVSVGVDDVAAAAVITRHLLTEHGVRRVGHISGPMAHQTAIDRYAGFRQALSELGEPTVQAHVEGDFSEESGARAAAELLDRDPALQAIFAANDEMALGALGVVRARGRRVPEDVALVGFDDFGVSRLTTPAVTTMHVPAEALGRVAAERLFDLINGVTPDAHTTLPVELVVRDSCGTH
jgi:LacI family transcriptional regulator